MYGLYPQNRLLGPEEEADVSRMVGWNVSTKRIREHCEEEYGKVLNLHDVRNVKQRIWKKETQIDGVQANSAQMLVKAVEEEEQRNPGLVVRFGLDPGQKLRFMFFQTALMKNLVRKFPEHIIIDTTYCINNCNMPLTSFICVDGNLESRVVAFALIPDETRETYEEIFQIFKCTNNVDVATFMVDKCMAEISALENVFPGSSVELCHFHTLDAFKRKINALDCSREEKDRVRVVVQDV